MQVESSQPHRRRPRYKGKNPRAFHEKYKELGQDVETIQKVLSSGKTPVGTHRPIMVQEILEVLRPQPGDFAVDCTLGYGGHAEALLERISPGGRLLGLDVDPIEQARTAERLLAKGWGLDVFRWQRCNFAGLAALLGQEGLLADVLLADLGVSSMQIDDPGRGFSFKSEGPFDMRMNPERGVSAAQLIERISAEKLARILVENGDEPSAELLAAELAGRFFSTTQALAQAISGVVPASVAEDTVRRVFQAIRIEVNDEFGALGIFPGADCAHAKPGIAFFDDAG